MFIGRTEVEAETPILWPPGAKSWLIRKDPDVEAETPILYPPDAKNWLIWKDPVIGKDWRQEEKGMTEDEMVAWHHQLDGHESDWALGVGDRQGSLACCSPWGHKELDTTEWLNWTDSGTVTFLIERHLSQWHLLSIVLLKGIATHSSIPAWRIPWTEELGGLQSMRSQRVGHDWVTNTYKC